MAGPIALTLHASSSNRNMVIIANLYDVPPEGIATHISRGVILGSQSEVDSANASQEKAFLDQKKSLFLINLVSPSRFDGNY